MHILRFIVTWAFATNEKVWKLSDSTRGHFQVEEDELWSMSLKEDASFYFNLKTFSCQV